ncbi:MAG TPA: MCE family protein [Spirochaetes bacterium]|nr:MCE family protein [Spirochaetota bacterium]
MRRRFKKTERLVSLFILATLLIIFTTFVLMGKINRWFSPKYVYHTEFKSAKDLKVGTPITFRENGWEIGNVSNIKLNETNNKIVVYFEIFEEYVSKIREDSIAYLSKTGFAGIAGTISINISISTSDRYPIVGNNRPLPSSDSEEGKLMLTDRKLTISQDVEANIAHIAANINRMTDPSGPLMQTLYNVESLTRQAKDSIEFKEIDLLVKSVNKKINKSLDDVNKITGELDQLVKTNSDRLDRTFDVLTDQISLILSKLSKTINTILDKVIKSSDPIFKDAQKAITLTLKQLTTSISATVGSLENNVTASLKDIRLIIQNIKIMTRRVNTLLDQVEQLPILGGKKKKKPLLIDEVEREDY